MTSDHSNSTALTIGLFDGVHRGHAALVSRAREAVGPDGRVVAMTFDPPPAQVLGRSQDERLLTSLERRIELLKATGADAVQVLHADTALLALSPEAFIDAHIAPLQLGVIVEGPDFRFGARRAGDLQLLRSACEQVEVVDPVLGTLADGGQVEVRSGLLRWLIAAGRVAEVIPLAGRPHRITGTVVKGMQRGRDLGVPTANLDAVDACIPMDGVYGAVGIMPDGSSRAAAVSIGTNPTFGDTQRTVEAHLLDHDGSLYDYGWTLSIDLRHFIREQITCDSLESLKALIAHDLDIIRTRHAQGEYALAP